ncbi:endonuclease III [Candidatus Bathyarchaeota archaeon]|nr:endonuclease III [Candidatus Bathyarchaeota archaeon]
MMEADKTRARKILQILRESFTMPKWISSKQDPFETLIITIISQNTSDRNTEKAFQKLSEKFPITPEALAKAETVEIEECLKVAGLYRNKARVIKEVSKIILEKFNGGLKPILDMPFEEARKTLLQLPGIGPKTADVLLLFSANRPTVPVDTHVKRVSKRLGLAPTDGDYEDVRRTLQLLYEPRDYLAVHILLILLGRKYCKALKPLCEQCPVRVFCPSRRG